MLSELPNGTLTSAPCRGASLNVLIGDSIDRELVRSRCASPVRYAPAVCAKCVVCNSDQCGTDAWVNIMHFGIGLRGCQHNDRPWGTSEQEVHDARSRVASLLKPLLASPAASTFSRIVISLHSGAWDVLTSKECGANITDALLRTPGEWLKNAAYHLVDGVSAVLDKLPPATAHLVRRPLLWRTMPLICRSFKAGEDASELFHAASILGVRLACRHGLTIVDMRTLSCTDALHSKLLSDGTHFTDAAYTVMAAELQRRARTRLDGTGGDAAEVARFCSDPSASQSRCECRLCKKYAAFTWSLGRATTQASCNLYQRHHPQQPQSQQLPQWSTPDPTTFSCRRGTLPVGRVPIALFTLAAYPSLRDPADWMMASARGWHANAHLLHTYVIASSQIPASWAPANSNVVELLFADGLIPALLRHAAAVPSGQDLLTSLPRAPRLASFSPMLPGFAESQCALDLSGYSFFGTIELDVVLGGLADFVAPYFAPGYDAIALRWAPAARTKGWRSAEEAVSHNTLADATFGAVMLSTPLLLVRNNETTRRWWWAAEEWLRQREKPGFYSLRLSLTCKTCTSPVFWFDEHNYAHYWRDELARASVRVAYVCCAIADHHIDDRHTGCVVTWSNGALNRRCANAELYTWDGAGCSRESLGSEACAKLPRHAARLGLSAACTSPGKSYGYDVAWTNSTGAIVVGGGDSVASLLRDGSGRCGDDSSLIRSVAAFHAAKSKHHHRAPGSPPVGSHFELHPRFLHSL